MPNQNKTTTSPTIGSQNIGADTPFENRRPEESEQPGTRDTPEQQRREEKSNEQVQSQLKTQQNRLNSLNLDSGTIENISNQISQLSETISNLPNVQAPKREDRQGQADQVKKSQTEPPTDTPDTQGEAEAADTSESIANSAKGALAEADTNEEMREIIKSRLVEAGEGEETAQTNVENLLNQLKNVFQGRSREDVREERFQEAGGEQAFQKVKKLRPEVAALEEKSRQLDVQMQEEMRQAEQRLASQSTIENEKREIRRRFRREKAFLSADLGAKAATLEAWSQNFNSARSIAQDAAKAFASDRRIQAQQMQFLVNQQQQFMDSMDQEVQNYMNTLVNLNKREANRQQQEFQTKMDLVTTAATNGVDLGWTTNQIKNMSPDRALEDFNSKIKEAGIGQEVEAEEEVNDSTRVTDINEFFRQSVSRRRRQSISANADFSGDILADEYVKAQQLWISKGGTKTDFQAAFPPESVVAEDELDNLPANIRSEPISNPYQ